MRRNELLGLRWDDFDEAGATLSINRGLVAVGYEMHEARGKTATLADASTSTHHPRHPQRVARMAAHGARRRQHRHGRVDVHRRRRPPHPPALDLPDLRAVARPADVPVIRLQDLRQTHGTLLIAAGVPVKVVSERLGHARPAFTIDTYQHVLPDMQANAACVFESLIVPGLLPAASSREKRRKKTA